MVFRGRDFLRISDQLANSVDRDDAKLRTAIGRSYYAAFLETRELWKEKRLAPPIANNGSDHRTLGNEFGQIASNDRGILRRLHEYRSAADYDIPIPAHYDLQQVAERASEMARDVIQYVDDFRSSFSGG